jgi:hypothetical protein
MNVNVVRILSEKEKADLSRVKIRRQDSQTGATREILVDATAIKGQVAKDIPLQDGDVIEVSAKP